MASKKAQVPKLDESAFDSIFTQNPGYRKRAIDSLLTASEGQAQDDGGRFLPFAKLMKLIDAAVDDTGDPAARVIAICTEERIPVPEGALRRRFENACVDRYVRSDPSKTHIFFHQMYRKKKDEDGLTWYRYFGTSTAVNHCKTELINMGVPLERIKIVEEDLLMVNFLHPSLKVEKPKIVVQQDPNEDESEY